MIENFRKSKKMSLLRGSKFEMVKNWNRSERCFSKIMSKRVFACKGVKLVLLEKVWEVFYNRIFGTIEN